ncbi:MAG: IPT/TIG domain-containing protein [Actinomycetales bacterium]
MTGTSPGSGPMAGGTAVTISGVNLDVVTGVRFGSTSASISSQSATRMVVVAPAASGTYSVNILLEHPKGVVEAGPFAYLP